MLAIHLMDHLHPAYSKDYLLAYPCVAPVIRLFSIKSVADSLIPEEVAVASGAKEKRWILEACNAFMLIEPGFHFHLSAFNIHAYSFLELFHVLLRIIWFIDFYLLLVFYLLGEIAMVIEVRYDSQRYLQVSCWLEDVA